MSQQQFEHAIIVGGYLGRSVGSSRCYPYEEEFA